MKQFLKYQHIERLGTSEVKGIEYGESYVFPKIDGTNGSIWIDKNGELQAGSRRRHLTLDKDNAGFLQWAHKNEKLLAYITDYPEHRLFGEWLVPHSLKTYRNDAWRRFYIFDVAIDKSQDEIKHEGDSALKYIPYTEYHDILMSYNLDVIPALAVVERVDYNQLQSLLEKNTYLIKDGEGIGEGLVIKNYNFFNKHGRQTWAKVVTSEFKEKHMHAMGVLTIKAKKLVEEDAAKEFVTVALCEKVLAKITLEVGFTSKIIPRLLNTIYYDVVREEIWHIIKKYKNPEINFKTFQHFVYEEAKKKLPIIFKF